MNQPLGAGPTVSIIISAYNRPQVVTYAIRSVLNSDFDDFELLVIGDGCNEATKEAVVAFSDPRIRFFNLPTNTGSQSAPHNEGVRRARGKYVLFLNQDDMYFPDHVSGSVDFMEESGADVAWSPVLLLRKVATTSGPLDLERDVLGVDGAVLGSRFDPTRFVVSSSWVVRREICDAVGPWLAIEETRLSPSQEWLFRAWLQGRRMAYHRHISVLCIHSGVRRYSYVSPRSLEHERAWDWIAAGLAGRAELLGGLAVQQSGELLRQSRKRVSRGLLHFAGEKLAQVGVHPHVAKRLLKGWGRGRFVLNHRRFTSEPPRLASGTPVLLGAKGIDGFLGEGWHGAEKLGRWTSGATAEIFFSLPEGRPSGVLEVRGRPLRDGDPVSFSLSDGTGIRWVFDEGDGGARLKIKSPGPFRLEIGVERPTTPSALGISGDIRTLGFFAAAISFIESGSGS